MLFFAIAVKWEQLSQYNVLKNVVFGSHSVTRAAVIFAFIECVVDCSIG